MLCRYAVRAGLLLLSSSLALGAGPAPLIDNDRVTVWDLSLDKGQTGPATPADRDAVIMYLEGGRVQTHEASGKSSVSIRAFGDAIFVPRGSASADTVLSGGPVFEVVIALKEHPASRPSVTNVYPPAFPRPGSVMALDNERCTVWRYDWKVGVPTAMHVHDKDFVVAFRYSAEQKIVQPDGQVRTASINAGDTRFLASGLTHSEEFPTDPQSAVFLELK